MGENQIKESINEEDDDDIICNCFQVRESEIRDCIAENDVTEIEEVTTICDAGGNCQTCHILIQLFIDQHHQKNTSTKNLLLDDSKKKVNRKGFFDRLFANA